VKANRTEEQLMKTVRRNITFGILSLLMITLATLFLPLVVTAQQTWRAAIGAASKDQAEQAMAFLPNELWIYVNDSITWTAQTPESHTLTFLKQDTVPAQQRPLFFLGCPGAPGGVTPDNPIPTFGGTPCVNSGIFTTPGTYTVKFPTPGNFKFVCLIHSDMTGVVHVLPLTATLPHNQAFYDNLADQQADNIIKDADARIANKQLANSANQVITTGEIVASGGGRAYLAIMRFLPDTITVHVGDTVEWTNEHPTEPHTVTFGIEPGNPGMPVGVSGDLDGALHGTLPNAATTDSFNSGFFAASLQDQVGNPQTPIGVTRVRVTFTKAGTYNYICAIHDELGMKGTVIVKK
jgi:plastocyanin